MKKLRVIHYCNQLSLGGTERTMELFCKYLNHEKFEIFAVSMRLRESFIKKFRVYFGLLIRNRVAITKYKIWSHRMARVPNFERILGKQNVIIVNNEEELHDKLIELNPDILHVHYSGNPEPPTNDAVLLQKIPTTITTNQFEIENTSKAHEFVKKIFFVSKWLYEKKAKWAHGDSRVEIFYNPIELPTSTENLRSKLQIPKDAFVVGRVGRSDPGIHDPISVQAFKILQDSLPQRKYFFLSLSSPSNMIEDAHRLGIQNFIDLPPTVSDVELSRFYNTIDVLAHARRDGETFGCNIAEAMIHKKPVVTHLCDYMNAQAETIASAGFVTAKDDYKAYADYLIRLATDLDLYKERSENGYQYALANYEIKTLSARLEKIYLSNCPF